MKIISRPLSGGGGEFGGMEVIYIPTCIKLI